MARLLRKSQKVFAGNATNNGIFGSLQSGNPQTTNDVEQLQSLPAYNQGWNAATMTSETLPALEETQALNYINTYQLTYLLQEGIPEYSASTTYYKGSLVKYVNSNGFQILSSKTDDNQGNGVTNQDYWNIEFDSTNPPQLVSNMVNDLDSPDQTTYPTSEAVKNYVDTALDNFEGDFVTPAQLQQVNESALHKTGDEEKDGSLTFLSSVATNPFPVAIKNLQMDATQSSFPSELEYSKYIFYDKNGNEIGNFSVSQDINGDINTYMQAVSFSTGERVAKTLSLTNGADGKGYIRGITPPDAADNTTKVPTTAWTTSRINSIMNSNLIGTSTTCLKIKTSARTYIVQWGRATVNNNYTFPIPFTSIPIMANALIFTESNSYAVGFTGISQTGFKKYCINDRFADWIAIGY